MSSEWDKINHEVAKGSIHGLTLFLFYIYDLPKVVNDNTEPVLFADDISIIASNPNLVEFKNSLISPFQQLNAWFNINLLSLNYNKTQFIPFVTTNNQTTHLDISYNNRYIPDDTNTQFLGITIDSSLSWKQHIDNLMVKLSRACYAIRSLRPFISHESLRMNYFSYFHTVMSYGKIFWGNTLYSNNIFKLQKRVIRIITNSRNRDSCRELFKELNILPFYSQYIFSLLTFIIDNMSLFKLNSDLHNFNTTGKIGLHFLQPRLSIYSNDVYYMGMKTFNHLHSFIKKLSDNKNQFKSILKSFTAILLFTEGFF
jgi:hypothetical protein